MGKYIPVILAFLAMAFAGCREPVVLEYEYLLTPKVVEFHRDGNRFLKISGHCGHSALAVDKTVSERKNDGVHVYVYLALVNDERRSGALDHEITIPDGVNRVFLGKKERLIWERKR